ncbi:hypothetical protein [Marichromatium gracile]|uniref:hypothetical protein n=1 Tax=Marichromatium gracile TaxID=1048 RepID=UPI001A923560|nr:hypothetical protein [Marichromatium gracile]
MNQSIFDLVIENPQVFIGEFIFAALPSALLAYGVVWLIMRPRKGKKLRPPTWNWHLIGILSSLFGAATLRFLAMATFAGRSAFEPAAENGEAGIYLLVLPAIIAAFYISWLKSRRLTTK